MSEPAFEITLATPQSPGAVAIVQLHGRGIPKVLQDLTDRNDWPPGRVRLVSFSGIDEGLAVVLRDGENAIAQVMPHGGPHVVRKIIDRLIAFGGTYAAAPPARVMYPEADSDLEADVLAAIARAASPRAIDLLAAQPRLWRAWLRDPGNLTPEAAQAILQRAAVLDRLIHPPTVVVMGRPNVGKSTLANHLAGRSASLVADLPGTTRDWVGALVLLDDVAVQWIDTPGLRASDDQIEQAAIALSREVIERADVLIAMRDPVEGFPDTSTLARRPDLWVMNKVDRLNKESLEHQTLLSIRAQTGQGVESLIRAVLDVLGLADVADEELWAFSERLRRMLAPENVNEMLQYVEP